MIFDNVKYGSILSSTTVVCQVLNYLEAVWSIRGHSDRLIDQAGQTFDDQADHRRTTTRKYLEQL